MMAGKSWRVNRPELLCSYLQCGYLLQVKLREVNRMGVCCYVNSKPSALRLMRAEFYMHFAFSCASCRDCLVGGIFSCYWDSLDVLVFLHYALPNDAVASVREDDDCESDNPVEQVCFLVVIHDGASCIFSCQAFP